MNGLAENMVKNVKQWLSKQSCGVEFVQVLAYISQCATFNNWKVTCTNPVWTCTSYPVIIWSTLYERTSERTTATTGRTGGPTSVSPGGGCVDKRLLTKCYKQVDVWYPTIISWPIALHGRDSKWSPEKSTY